MATVIFPLSQPVLASRNRGKEIADRLREISLELPLEDQLAVSFAQVEAASAPCLQEILACLDDRFPGRYQLLEMNEDVGETLAFVRNRRAA
jgi:hypothetical protein